MSFSSCGEACEVTVGCEALGGDRRMPVGKKGLGRGRGWRRRRRQQGCVGKGMRCTLFKFSKEKLFVERA